MSAKGHDGLTWQQRREAKKRYARLTTGWYMVCKKHGRQAVEPFDATMLVCGCSISGEDDDGDVG